MRIVYTTLIYFFYLLVKVGFVFSQKCKFWVNGRKNIFLRLQEKCADKEQIVWFHCASLGEFEQGKPLMQKMKKAYPATTILLTFFSPSGYEVKKNDTAADLIFYLPLDTPKNAKQFLEIVKPQKAIFVKYEFWYNYIHQLDKRNIPFYYVSANFRPNHYFFKWYGKWFLNEINKCRFFFVQNELSKRLLLNKGIENVLVSGDTRFDRVNDIAKQDYTLDFVEQLQERKKLLVAGSTWQPDEDLLANLFANIATNYKLIIAPHLVDRAHINQIVAKFAQFKVCKLSDFNTNNWEADAQILIIDTIGILSKVYKYAHISYVGGGFATGLHNILEPAVFQIPIFFGKNYHKFNEAVELIEKGAAFSIYNAAEMLQIINHLDNTKVEYQKVCDICQKYVTQNVGAADKIMQFMNQE